MHKSLTAGLTTLGHHQYRIPNGRVNRIKKHLEKFGEITGLQRNCQKLEMMFLNHNKLEQELFVDKYDFKICNSVKYLGIDILKDIQKMK